MGDLGGMLDFLRKTNENLQEIIRKLDEMQLYFNNNFSNVNEIRNAEIRFLQDKFLQDPSGFPEKIRDSYKKKLREEETAFKENMGKLEKEKKALSVRMDEANKLRSSLFDRIRKSNVSLDNKEEKLKENVDQLENEIDEYNKRIGEMTTGFGFISNLFRMRKIQKDKEKLLERRDSIIIEIEDIRGKWQKRTRKFTKDEKEALDQWNTTQTELSIVTEKVENLKANRENIIKKAAFASALNDLRGDESFITSAIKAGKPDSCSRCKSKNGENLFFCRFCGERFSSDRPDVMGSLVEVGELNAVHENLLKGITETVSILALMKGMLKGVQEFTKSVSSVKDSQDKYSALPKLKIDVPEFSQMFNGVIEELNPKVDVKFFNLHPLEFSQSFKDYTEKFFTDSNIEKFFTGMGDELNKTTKEQW